VERGHGKSTRKGNSLVAYSTFQALVQNGTETSRDADNVAPRRQPTYW